MARPRLVERAPVKGPLSIVLLSVDGRPDGVCDELLFEVLLFDHQPSCRTWRQGDCVAVLRASDELDAVLWAGQIRERLHEHGLRLSAGVASTSGTKSAGRLLSEAEWALDRVRHHGGDMVLAHSTTVAVNDHRR
ncbi:MAG: hypothetical protein JJ863_25620 [Deltaproteobacteria bacterium]|nr:hypothetical protein [Deltaproteobacteria bacterium]